MARQYINVGSPIPSVSAFWEKRTKNEKYHR